VSDPPNFDELIGPIVRDRQRVAVVERDNHLTTASFLPASGDRVVNEDAPHSLRSHGEKVAAILPLDAVQLVELQPGFVNEGSR